jgi:hypothetical protein
MTMSGRFIDYGIRILAAVALLAVMSSPTRPTSATQTTPTLNPLPRNFAILEIGRSGQFAMSARPSLREAAALQADLEDAQDADIEEELTVTSRPAPVCFDRLPSPCPKPHSILVSFAVALAARPLRC